MEEHLAAIFGDSTYGSFFPHDFGIGVQVGGQLTGTGDAITTYHAERVLQRFLPHVMMLSLFDVDTCHTDFNGYLQGQILVDACVRHLWETIQSTEGLKDETALFVLPEHGRQLFFNGKNPDSLGRSGLDHGIGDDGDRDVWVLALGPDFKPGVVKYADPDGDLGQGIASIHDCRAEGMVTRLPIPRIANDEAVLQGVAIEGELTLTVADVGSVTPSSYVPGVCADLGSLPPRTAHRHSASSSPPTLTRTIGI